MQPAEITLFFSFNGLKLHDLIGDFSIIHFEPPIKSKYYNRNKLGASDELKSKKQGNQGLTIRENVII